VLARAASRLSFVVALCAAALSGPSLAVASCGSFFDASLERPSCCRTAKLTRITRVGGDCCGNPQLDEIVPVTASALEGDVPPAVVARLAAPPASLEAREADRVPPAARPPPRAPPGETTVLLL
jgi:hypothetical protein